MIFGPDPPNPSKTFPTFCHFLGGRGNILTIAFMNCEFKLLSNWFVLTVKPKLPLIIKSGQLCTVGKKIWSFQYPLKFISSSER